MSIFICKYQVLLTGWITCFSREPFTLIASLDAQIQVAVCQAHSALAKETVTSDSVALTSILVMCQISELLCVAFQTLFFKMRKSNRTERIETGLECGRGQVAVWLGG